MDHKQDMLEAMKSDRWSAMGLPSRRKGKKRNEQSRQAAVSGKWDKMQGLGSKRTVRKEIEEKIKQRLEMQSGWEGVHRTAVRR